VFCWPSVLLDAWGTKAKKHICSRNEWFVGLAAEGGNAKKPLISGKRVVSWPWYPRPSKNHWAKKPLRDPSDLVTQALPRKLPKSLYGLLEPRGHASKGRSKGQASTRCFLLGFENTPLDSRRPLHPQVAKSNALNLVAVMIGH
jgi:hypothetical protein